MKPGDIFRTTKSGDIQIVFVESSQKIHVVFLDTGNTKTARSYDIRNGNVYDREGVAPVSVADGTVHDSTSYGRVVVVKYTNVDDILVRFLDFGVEKTVRARALRLGYITPL